MENSRIKNTSKNIFYSIILQFVKILLVFINRIIFTKILGPAYLGINGLFSNVLSVLSLADLGLSTAMMYNLYKPLADHDDKKISQYLNYFKKIYNIIALSVFAIGISLIPFLKYLVNLPQEMPHIYLYYIIVLLNTTASYLFVYKTTLLSADQKLYVVNIYDTIFQFILFIFQIGVLLLTKSFALYLLVNVFCTICSNFFKVRAVKKIYPKLNDFKYVTLSKEEKKKIFSNIYSTFFYRLGSVIQGNTDNILISIFVGTIVVGYYSNYSMIILAITNFITIIFTSIKASVGNYLISKDRKEQLNLFEKLEIYNFWIVGFSSLCFIVLIPDFITICFGKEYLLSFGVLIWIVLNFYTSNIRQTIWTFRETTGLFNKTKYITLIVSVINLILSIIFGYFFGLIGILSATVISRMIYAWWKEPMILYNDYFKVSVKSYIVNYIKRLILISFIIIITCTICLYLPFNIFINFVIKMFICIIMPTIIFYLVYRKSDAFIYIKKILLKNKLK